MPITTLPNPGMDFTPLTPLTAEEMDDIVENIEAINNATIQTGSIANGAVNKSKLAQDVLDNYSLSEVDTGATWIDGKKIYKKTFTKDVTIPSGNSSSSSYVIAIGANIDTVVKIEAFTKREANSQFFEDYTGPLNFWEGDNAYRSLYVTISGNIEVAWNLTGYGDSVLHDYITLYYTKAS